MEASQIQNLFAGNIRRLLVQTEIDYDRLYEIRLRAGRPLFLTYDKGECFLRTKGREPYVVTREDLKETLEYVSGYSLYAYEDELRQGYMSVQGGHRVGVTGKVILDGDRIRGMKYISTLLRDVIRQLSNGFGKIPGVTVGVVDERSELAGCYQGIPQNDLGMRTDVLDCCPKAQGMQMLIRAMSPAVVAVDELGKEEDFRAVEAVIHSGCRLIATAHGENVEAVLATPFFAGLKKMRVFDRYIVLGKEKRAGIIRGIFDGRGVPC